MLNVHACFCVAAEDTRRATREGRGVAYNSNLNTTTINTQNGAAWHKSVQSCPFIDVTPFFSFFPRKYSQKLTLTYKLFFRFILKPWRECLLGSQTPEIRVT